MFAAIRVAGPRCLLPVCAAAMLAACSGGKGDAGSVAPDASGGGGSGTTTTSAVGLWSGTLTPDDPAQPPLSGWLTVTPDGTFQLDTDAALFTGTAQKHDSTLAASATGHAYVTEFAGGGAFTFNGTVAQSALTGKWSGGGRSGSMRFQHENTASKQPASLALLTSTYQGELWIGSATQPATIAVAADGSFTASTSSGCTASGAIGIADATRNRYQWTATLGGCGTDGAASGNGFMIGDYAIYLSGTLPDGAAVWMGGVDADAPTR